MARAGDVFEDPATGERLVVRRAAVDRGGETLEYDLWFVLRGFPASEARVHAHFASRPPLAPYSEAT